MIKFPLSQNYHTARIYTSLYLTELNVLIKQLIAFSKEFHNRPFIWQ